MASIVVLSSMSIIKAHEAMGGGYSQQLVSYCESWIRSWHEWFVLHDRLNSRSNSTEALIYRQHNQIPKDNQRNNKLDSNQGRTCTTTYRKMSSRLLLHNISIFHNHIEPANWSVASLKTWLELRRLILVAYQQKTSNTTSSRCSMVDFDSHGDAT